MNRYILTPLLCFSLAPLAGLAQEEDEGPSSYIYATYHYCTTHGQNRADELFEQVDKPIMDQLHADGKITAYGWLVHHTGGQWRRLTYFAAPSLDALLDAQDARNAAGEEADPDGKLAKEFGEACPNHDDYIWASANVGTGATERGPAGFSVYFVCNESREDRADEIVTKHFAPIYDKAVADGKLTSWGWSEHWVGGQYRRLLSTTGADHKSLLNARNEILEAAFDAEGMAEVGAEFSEICGSHTDYMWDIVHEKP